MKTRVVPILVVLALVAGAVSLLAAGGTVKPFVADPKAKEVSVTITIADSGFSPKEITVYEGQKVTFEISVPGETANAHTFTLPEFGINKVIEKGKPEKITFEASKVGVFAFAATEKETTEKSEGALTGTLKVEKPAK